MAMLMSILRATIIAIAQGWLCRLIGWMRPRPPARPAYVYRSPGYTVESSGACQEGSYIETWKPDIPFTDAAGRQKAVIFLHGFVLGASQIYRAHLDHLARQGYWVFFPNFQTGFCSFPPDRLLTLAELLDEVIGEGRPSQERWLKNALDSVSAAYARAGFGPGAAVETHVYGHSLGGLFALSWPYYVTRDGYPAELMPAQVVTADPIPTNDATAAPGQMAKALRQMQSDVDLRLTGAALTMPVAILHGGSDWIVPKESWDTPFGWIASAHKKMYLSQTDIHGCPGLFANHEQATTDTSFFSPLAATVLLDGVGSEDALDWNYLWHGLDQVIGGTRADSLDFAMGRWTDGQAVKPVTTYLPAV